MRHPPRPSISRPLLSIAAASGCIAVLGLGAATSRDNLERTFAAALDQTAPITVAAERRAPPRDGSEDFWLNGERPAGIVQAALAGALEVGQRIVLHTGNGSQELEVVDVKPLNAQDFGDQTRVDAYGRGVLLMVTGRAPGSAALVRFLAEDASTATGVGTGDGRAL